MTDADQDLAHALKRAAQVVESASIPDDLRTTAFDRILSQLLNGGSDRPAIQRPTGPAAAATTDTIAEKLGVSSDEASEVFQPQQDGTYSVHAPTGKLAKTKSAATKQLALLVMAGRQVSEEWTDSEEIIKTLQHYAKFDSANNAAIMKEGEEYWMVSGSGKSRKFKLRKTGWEAAAELLKSMDGD